MLIRWNFGGDISLVWHFLLSVAEVEREVEHGGDTREKRRTVPAIPDKIIPKTSTSTVLRNLNLGRLRYRCITPV